MQYFVLLIFIALTTCAEVDEAEVNYFLNLINEEIAKIKTTELPTDSSSFEASALRVRHFGVYDYIVVGAGSAGAVIASRLSENPKNKILLLEAGGYESDFSDIPGFDTTLRSSPFNWNYKSTPQSSACLATQGSRCPYPRGKGLGGTSLIYTLIHTRGNKIDYDRWCEKGNPGWCFKDVFPLFKKSEHFLQGDAGYHGVGGNINVEYHNPDSHQLNAFLEGNVELGRKIVDYNGEEQLGVSKIQSNTIHGRRDSTGKAYLRPAENRTNLHISPNSLVIKVLIHPITKKAHSVLFSHGGTLFRVKARREIIVSAGVVGSPQLLMLSGIGPRAHLQEMDIPLINDLPVGENFNEQVAFYDLFFHTNSSAENNTLREQVIQYLQGYGRLTMASGVEGLGFFQTPSEKTPGLPNIEIVITPPINTNGIIPNSLNFGEDYLDVLRTIDFSRTFRLTVILLRPKSRGVIKLESNYLYGYPLIDVGLLSDAKGEDLATLHDGIQIAINMTKTNAFARLNTTIINNSHPACRQYVFLSRDYWYCQMRQLSGHIAHAVGTCKMGPNPAKGAVVDHELRVHGIRYLRVADASIMPEEVSAHTHWPAVMIGEKMAQILQNTK